MSPALDATLPALVTAAHREIRRRSLLAHAQHVYRGYEVGPHLQAIATALEAVEAGHITRLIIQVPPRHGKSLLASIIFPGWYLGRNTDNRIIACSYSADLSYDFSAKARDLMLSAAYAEVFPQAELDPDRRAVKQWDLNKPNRGGYVSAGVGGGITGKGANVLLIDDPVKNAEEAASIGALDSHWNWYTSTAYTRLEGFGAVILIMTRWNEDDLAGRLLAAEKNGGDRWHVVNLPALAEENDALGRAIDEPLWPAKYNADDLQRIRAVVGPRDFSALYQQRPSPAAGAVFRREWWQRYRTFDHRKARRIIQVWDTAFKTKETNDFSVCTTWALAENGAYVLDMFRDRVEFPELRRKAIDTHRRWRPRLILIEDRASGQSLIQVLRAETRLPLLPVPTTGDKLARANAVSEYVEGGRVFLPEDAPWVDEFIEEHAQFPNGAHDDIVDTTTMALLRLFGRRAGAPSTSGPRPVTQTYTSR